MLLNIVDDPVFTKEDVEETKYAIAEETKIILNNKNRIVRALYYRNLYKSLDLYHETLSIIGNESTTYELDYDTLKACYDAFYYDENKTLLIAGNFNEKEMTNYIEGVYKDIPTHKKRLKEFKYGNFDEIKKQKDIYYMATSDDIVTIGFKQKNSIFSVKEIHYFLYYIYDSKLQSDSTFVQRLKKDNIISSFQGFSDNYLNDIYYDFSISANVKDINEFEKAVIKELKANNFKENDFYLFIKGLISSEARTIDIKYNRFQMFSFRTKFTDDFDDIDFLKNLSFDRFLEFYNSLQFHNYVISIVRDSK